ncbi:hypothetical protein [Azospirillum sp. NL1]|uniref:hypothetical protein n=1 Tax=Azospirillum sp. NL1 TaxID=3082952 RepID=UPI00147904A5|nr:hypothetical protein [Azospirillum sp. NL1]
MPKVDGWGRDGAGNHEAGPAPLHRTIMTADMAMLSKIKWKPANPNSIPRVEGRYPASSHRNHRFKWSDTLFPSWQNFVVTEPPNSQSA